MNCDRAQPLVPRYLDGELSDAEATALRPHLLECPRCRSVAQVARSLAAWFVPTPPVAVPQGFAARVARRAFAGDRGRFDESGEPVRELVPAGAASGTAPRGTLLNFAMGAVVAAALVLVVFAIAIRRLELPDGGGLQAETQTVEESLEALRRLNAAEEGRAANDRPVAGPAAEDGAR